MATSSPLHTAGHGAFGYAEATVRRDFQYIVNQYPGMIRGHGCLDFDDSTDDKEYVFDVKRTLQSVAKEK